jgi:hypothetical protein
MATSISNTDLDLNELFLNNKLVVRFNFNNTRTTENLEDSNDSNLKTNAIVVQNFIYYLKTETLKGQEKHQRFICKNTSKKLKCHSSLSLINGSIVKVDGKNIVDNTPERVLAYYHKTETCSHTEIQIEQIFSMNRMKERARTENVSAKKILEEETLRLGRG